MKRETICFILFFSFFILSSLPSYAQESYTPPPLFVEPRLPPPDANPARNIGAPRISREVEETKMPVQQGEKLIEKRIVETIPDVPKNEAIDDFDEGELLVNEPSVSLPIPSTKPPVPKNFTNMLLAKEKEQGVVTGPKNMPAVKKESVQSETLFEIDEETSKQVINNFKNPPKTDFRFEFEVGAFELTNQQKEIIEKEIITFLKENNQYIIGIHSYASGIAGDINSDRRISLDRALQIRQELADAGIEAFRIDLKSYGDTGDLENPDFVKINLFIP
ncbi:MAG: OmpA family protein [Pseudomonadota bacterium]